MAEQKVFHSDKLKTAVRDLGWPAMPAPQMSLRMSMLNQLEETQWWSSDMLETFQMGQLNRLLEHAIKYVPVYQERLQEAGWDSGQPLTSEVFRNIPILDRDEVNRLGEKLYSNKQLERHGKKVKVRTSGSTGNPVTILRTTWAQVVWDVITIRDHLWNNRDFMLPMAIIRHFPSGYADPPHGKHSDSWGAPVSLFYSTGMADALTIVGSKVSDQLDWLMKINPVYLLTFPSNAEALVEYGNKTGKRPDRLREIRTIGETLTRETRDFISQQWDVTVSDCYSSQEVGYIALQAPGEKHYLVQAESVYTEIVNDRGEPCKPGEIGRVVVTPLQNFATPLIRYEIGDYAEVGEASPCGRGLPVLNQVMGRSRNMLVLPNGDRKFASLGIKKFNKTHDSRIHKYQTIQTRVDALNLKLVMDGQLNDSEEKSLAKHIEDRTGYAYKIEVDYVDDIPRSAGGKYEDFRCEISP